VKEPIFFNIDEFSEPMSSKPTSIPPHVKRSKRQIAQQAARRARLKSKVLPLPPNSVDIFDTKTKRKLRVEPYDRDARDADGDGIVQEGTVWERPVGYRIVNSAGREIAAGATAEFPLSGISYVDKNGESVAYKPRWASGAPRSPVPMGGSIGESLPSVGQLQDRPSYSDGDDFKTLIQKLRNAVTSLKRERPAPRNRVRPVLRPDDLKKDPADARKIGWEETDEARRAYEAIDKAGELLLNEIHKRLNNGEDPTEKLKVFAEYLEEKKRRSKEYDANLSKMRDLQLNAHLDFLNKALDASETEDAEKYIKKIIRKLKTSKTKGMTVDFDYDDMKSLLYLSIREGRNSPFNELVVSELAKYIPDEDEFEAVRGSRSVDKTDASKILEHLRGVFSFSDSLVKNFAKEEYEELDKWLKNYRSEKNEIKEEWEKIDFLASATKNRAVLVEVLKEIRSDIGTADLFDTFNKSTIRKNQNITVDDIIKGIEDVAAILPGDWIKKYQEFHQTKQGFQWVKRGHYNDSIGNIAVSPGAIGGWKGTLIHELTHSFEYHVPGIVAAEHLFFNRKGKELYGDKAPKPRKYGAGQQIIELELSDEYASVFYEYDIYELMTMSMQRIFTGDMKIPNDQAKFVLGVLALL
jgi:hypothetical protein